jgi:predicted nucleic acid-binding protein
MKLYLDSAYVAKCYLNDSDAEAVRQVAYEAESLHSSAWCIPEVACAIQRWVREGSLGPGQGRGLRQRFLEHVRQGVWTLLPVTEDLLRQVAAALDRLPRRVGLRAGDAVHLVSAQSAGFEEIWSNDNHLLRAAHYFGLRGRSAAGSL